MNKSNNLDFSGTTIFCGLDVHLKSWRVNIRDQDMELRDFSQNPDPVALHHFLTKNYPNATYKVGYEAGFCGFGIQRELAEFRPPNIKLGYALLLIVLPSSPNNAKPMFKQHLRWASSIFKSLQKIKLHFCYSSKITKNAKE
jgi:hypothetical protein